MFVSKERDKESRFFTYRAEDLDAVPEGANLGLGCGNPVALASLREGETVVDPGAGADLKEDYLDAIGQAGFREISIIDETIFPLRDFLGYANAVEVQGCSDALMEMARELETAIASIKVQAVKRKP